MRPEVPALVEVGREARKNKQTAAVLAELEQGGWYERLLSVQACHGSRDAERVLRGLSLPLFRILRGLNPGQPKQ